MSTALARLAIVGSTAFDRDRKATSAALDIISSAIMHLDPEVVISGGAVGIDSVAAELARSMGYDVIEHLPKYRRWKPDGYEARNLRIAQDCTHLLAIRHAASRTYGSGWTADRAGELGKVVYRRTVA